MKERAAKAVVRHQVNQKMGGGGDNSDKCQCLLGRFTVLFGAFTSACGAGVGIGSLAFLGEKTTVPTDSRNAVLYIGNSLSLTTFCLMLLVSFTMPNERYAPLFGFLQLAIGKAILMGFSSILIIGWALVFLTVQEKEYVGILIFVAAGFLIVAMFLVIARSCCYDNNQDIVRFDFQFFKNFLDFFDFLLPPLAFTNLTFITTFFSLCLASLGLVGKPILQ
jgi:hypothetical protein